MDIILTQTFLEFEEHINNIIRRFHFRYGGDIEELKAEANLMFVLAFDSYDEIKKIPFIGWVSFCIWKHLLNYIKKEYKQKFISLDNQINDENTFNSIISKTPYHPFYLTELLDELHNDSKFIIRLLFNPPEKLKQRILNKGTKPKNVRIGLKEYLREDLDWLGKQIKISFQEIKRTI